MTWIDLNCDMGESYGRYTLGLDAEVMPHITSANVACGWHAGDPSVMDHTVGLAKANGVAVGAHPGYPDLLGFGRRAMDCTLAELRNYIIYQIGALQAFCAAHGIRMQHVKPHGAMNNLAAEDPVVANAVAEAAASVDRNLLVFALAGPKGALLGDACAKLGVRAVFEAFPDRAYTPEGTLASRKLPGAVITDPDEVAARALMVAKEGRIRAMDGSLIPMDAQTICVHGDNQAALEEVKNIRKHLAAEGLRIAPVRDHDTFGADR